MWIRQNQLEQDEIAKAEMHNPFRKLPKPLMDKIRWCALEPTPTAKIMKDVAVLWRVFPDIRVLINVKSRSGVTFRDPRDPSFVIRREKVFAIDDIPLDTKLVGHWQFSGGAPPTWALPPACPTYDPPPTWALRTSPTNNHL